MMRIYRFIDVLLQATTSHGRTMMRYVQVRKVVADSQVILRHTVAAVRILLRAADSVSPIVVPEQVDYVLQHSYEVRGV
jgi:hypothetical protein